jgi:IclR family transcriptional regulator, KDG regulon repressor
MKKAAPRRAAANVVPSARQDAGEGLQSLQTAFRILDELSNARGPVGLTDLAATLGELKPRIYRHLS